MDEELHTPDEWQEILDYVILDPDGWRVEGAPSWDTPITREEFIDRASRSTIYVSMFLRDAERTEDEGS